ncbi:MAG: DUF169 domain-containing protein [Peptoniphilus sp.]|nr:DUF169 domain-containing protein [Peptoniphilus sp.]MDY3118521.1 DUF169 domain-containing protein [Peptoniphilus sp.]
MREFLEQVEKLYALLDLKYHAVGVALIDDTDSYCALPVEESKNPINYCGAVRAAACGHSLKIPRGKFRCKSAERFFGIDPVDSANANGENWYRLGMYSNEKISCNIRKRQVRIPGEHYGVAIKPLEEWEHVPQVILIFDLPYNVMRIVQGYSYVFGQSEKLRVLGNQAVCYESTTLPLMTDEINLSLLCIGTRHRAGWAKEDLSVGIPGDKFAGVIEGLEKTANIMEGDEDKKRIQSRWKEYWPPLDLQLGYNYYRECK